MNHNSILLKIFFNKENNIIGGKVARLRRKFPNILSYLNKRYPDSFSLKESINKRIQNNTWSTSKPEEELYLYIKERFPSVKRQYKDKERYPYFCDFYIPELDLFLELNGNWTHRNHPYDMNSKEDNSILNIWKEKSKEHPMYLSAIKTWVVSDVNKRNKAKENHLNFKEVWNLDEGKEFINKLTRRE